MKFSLYKENKRLLDLTQGPIAEPEEYKEAKEGNREWENVTLLRDENEIIRANQEWAKEHFQSAKVVEQNGERKITIEKSEVKAAINMIGKGKAGATDNIFTKKA